MKIFGFFVIGCFVLFPILIAIDEYNEKYKGNTREFINHLSEGIAMISTGVVPAVVSSIALGDIAGMLLMLLWWWIGILPNKKLCFYITSIITWIVGIVIGSCNDIHALIWFVYFILFINTLYYIICEILEDLSYHRRK